MSPDLISLSADHWQHALAGLLDILIFMFNSCANLRNDACQLGLIKAVPVPLTFPAEWAPPLQSLGPAF